VTELKSFFLHVLGIFELLIAHQFVELAGVVLLRYTKGKKPCFLREAPSERPPFAKTLPTPGGKYGLISAHRVWKNFFYEFLASARCAQQPCKPLSRDFL
jgi:hypothetical protein